MSTGMMHLVRDVMALRTASGSMVKSSSTSTITGLGADVDHDVRRSAIGVSGHDHLIARVRC